MFCHTLWPFSVSFKNRSIHPHSKKPVGDRPGTAAFNTVYGGRNSHTGPTLSGCSLADKTLVISFNKALLRGDSLVLKPTKPATFITRRKNVTIGGILYGQEGYKAAPSRSQSENATFGGSTLYVQTNATDFCMVRIHFALRKRH